MMRVAIILCLIIRVSTAAYSAEFADEGRILSLNALQERWAACRERCGPDVRALARLTTIDGLVIDETRNDILLVGRREAGRRPFHFEDLALAFQIAAHRFARREGNTIAITKPAVSLDPHPSDVAKLMQVGQLLQSASTPQRLQAALDGWVRACNSPHAVVVYGMPRGAIAQSALKIDYEMKRQVSGAAPLSHTDYVSLTDLTKRDIRAFYSGEAVAPPDISGMSRFWITPDVVNYRYDPASGAVLLDNFRLRILTEQQHLQGGRVVDRGGPGRLPQEWAENMSNLTRYLISSDPDWSRVEQFARLLSLAEILRDTEILKTPGVSPGRLVDEVVVGEVRMPDSYPGHAHIDLLRLATPTNNSTTKRRFTLPSCGGVSLSGDLTRGFVSSSAAGRLQRQTRYIRDAAPRSGFFSHYTMPTKK